MTKATKPIIDKENWRGAIFLLPKPSKIKPECKRLATKIIEENAIPEMWTLIKKHVVLKQPTRNLCVYFGNVLLKIWKLLSKEDGDEGIGAGEENKLQAFESDVLTDLFFNSIMVKKAFAEKFYSMVDGLREDTNKKVNYMLFRCSQPVLWRNLDVPNGIVRFAASMVLLKLYPLQAEDQMMNIEYLEKQHRAMKEMLTDDCVDIRVEATKRVLMHMSIMWVVIPREFIRGFMEIIIDKLTYDTAVEVRAAVYEGFPYLLHCAPALNASQHALKLIGKVGINDKSDRVRLAAFKLLNSLNGHRFIKFYEVVEMDEILHRLDFEHSEPVRLEIAKLLAKTYCSSNKSTVEERYNRTRHMVKTSRNGALQFHRLIFANNLIPIDVAVEHVVSLSTGACLKLRAVGLDLTMNQSTLDISNVTQMVANARDTNNAQSTIDFSLFNEAKSIIDCAIVLWTTMRKKLYTNEHNKENERLNHHMNKVMFRLFDEQYRNTVLMESALVIGSLLPGRKGDACYSLVAKMIEGGDLESDLMSHYIEAYATWDMNKMIEIIYNGLKELNRAFEFATNRSPPKKKTKPTPEKYRRPLDFINMILASANLHTYVVQKFGEHLPEFLDKLKRCKECIPQVTFGGPNLLTENLVILVYETYVLLSIIVNSEKITNGNSETENTSNDPMSPEIDWFFLNYHPSEPVLSNGFIQAFVRCLILYLDAMPHSIEVFRKLTELLDVLSEHFQRQENEEMLKSVTLAISATKEAIKYVDGDGKLLEVQLIRMMQNL